MAMTSEQAKAQQDSERRQNRAMVEQQNKRLKEMEKHPFLRGAAKGFAAGFASSMTAQIRAQKAKDDRDIADAKQKAKIESVREVDTSRITDKSEDRGMEY